MPKNNHNSSAANARDKAIQLARAKLSRLQTTEPSAKAELTEAEAKASPTHSKHQKYLLSLSESGMSLADIQTKWHEYYQQLPDDEKHAVWQEFYAEHQHRRDKMASDARAREHHANKATATAKPKGKQAIMRTMQAQSKHDRRKAHWKSLRFGLISGALAIVILSFGFFNERFIVPFITPSTNVSATPILFDPNDTSAPPGSKVIIPKINVEIPVVYETSTAEDDVQKALEEGVIHYATTPKPGELGNTAIFGHSSNNIFNPGKYKFAFLQLNKLQEEDIFYITRDGTRYAYRVYETLVVEPGDVWILNDAPGRAATAALVTCDPPGTALRRLVVWGEQISPEPAGNTASTANENAGATDELPSNAPSLWSRIF